MTKNLTYDATVTIELYLNQALEDLEREIWRAEKYEKNNLESLKEDREALREALAQVSKYGTYLANYAVPESEGHFHDDDIYGVGIEVGDR